MESNENKYKDTEVRKVITPSLLNKMIIRSCFLQSSFNYERMQACGWLFSLLPGLKAIHKDKDDLKKIYEITYGIFQYSPFLS